MPLQFTAAASSRVKKPGARTVNRNSLFAQHRRVKPSSQSSAQRSQKLRDEEDIESHSHDLHLVNQLPDLGPSPHIAETTLVNNVIQAIQHVQNTMFMDMPDSRTGMSSTRVAEVLNFRRSLPPIVSVAHVHVLLNSPTKVEREIADLTESARLRRLFIPGRGSALAGLGDCLVLVDDWEHMVRCSSSLGESLKGNYYTRLVF